MNFDLGEDQQLFRDSVERFAGSFDVAARDRMRQGDGGYPRPRWREAADLGLLSLAAPEAGGGIGGLPLDLALVAESLGKAIAPDPWLENGVLPARLAPALDGLLDGSRIAALAFAEPGRRYALEPAGTALRGDKVSGRKRLVLGGAMADVLLVTAKADNGFALVAVSADAPGVSRRPYRVTDGSLAAELDLHDAPGERLPVDAPAFADAVALARLLAAAEMLGLAQRAFDDTVAYVRQREQFGVPIGSFQALQHRLVDCYAAIEQVRSLVWRTALESAGGLDPAAVAGVKAFAGETMRRVIEEAVQMHGGMGQTHELAVGHALKRLMLLDRLFGDPDHCLAEYADAA